MAPNLSPIDEAGWLTPDTEALSWVADKRELMVRCRSQVLAITPGGGAACCEASRMVFDHLDQKNWYLMQTQLEDAAAQVSDDLCIMQESESGDWCLTAASLCAPTYWRLKDYIGRSLGGLHRSVPGGDPELSHRVDRIFTAMRPGQIMERCNWTVQAGDERFTPSSKPLRSMAANMRADREQVLEQLFLRVERQTIRKLPETGAVLFTIRVCMDPLAAVFAVPGAKHAFAEAWRKAPPELAEYKGWSAYQHLVETVLE